jgi:hypothetical protein
MRSMMMLTLFCCAAAPASAGAREYGVYGGKPGLMRIRGVAERAMHLPGGAGGWFLTLDVPGDGAPCSAELRDVSPLPGPLLKWVERVPNVGTTATLALDPERYLGSHSYRLSLRCGMRELSRVVVHLLPRTDPKAEVRFDMAQKASDEESSTQPIAPVPKGEL